MIRNNTNGDMGAFKFTTQKYYRINGGSTQLEGVKSDVVLPNRYSYVDMGEKDQENPLPWDEIQAANYDIWESSIDYETTVKRSKERLSNSDEIKLIDENAQWIEKVRSKNLYSLKYSDYDASLKQNEKESERFDALSDYTTNLSFESLPYEKPIMATDSIFKTKRERWHESLSKDIYMNEALNVLTDLNKMFKVKKVSALKN
jgi:carboxyl-terminal processing protease